MSDGDGRRRRAAENQAVFRSVNDRIKELNEAFDVFSPLGDWTCECADMHCVDMVQMTLAEYEAVRAHSNRFLVAPANEHVFPDVERIVERLDRYWIVEPIGAGSERAIELDSRG